MSKRQRVHFDEDKKNHCKQLKKRKLNQIFQSKYANELNSKDPSNYFSENNKVKVMSLFQTQQVHHDIIQILSGYLQEEDLYNLLQSNKYLYDVITNSEAIFKCILKRECNYYTPNCIIQQSLCKKDIICNINNPVLIYNRWKYIIRYPKNDVLVKKLQDKSFQQYILYKPIWRKIFSNTMTFNTIYRVLSFKFWSRQHLLNLFDHAEQYLTKRSLNNIEKQLFNPIKIKKVNNALRLCLASNEYSFTLKCVKNFQQFETIFNSLYCFHKWSDLINWNYFVISGSSVLASVIKKNWTQEKKHDIDIYSHSINYITFKKYIKKLHAAFSNLYSYEYEDYEHIVTFTLNIEKRKIILQFIFTCPSITSFTLNKIIENFDLDICQVLYNVKDKQILYTGAFIQSLKTEYIIPYYLMSNNKINQDIHILRIKKYIKKGFIKLLLPKNLLINTLEHLINNVTYEDVTYSRNIIPCDYFEVQKHLLLFLHE